MTKGKLSKHIIGRFFPDSSLNRRKTLFPLLEGIGVGKKNPFLKELLKIIGFALLFLFNINLYCQSTDITFTHYTVEDGLSQGSILTMLQDSKGLLWLGTADGLNRFNAYEFEIFRHSYSESSSISDNEIISLAEDPNGDIWIGTGNGLNRFVLEEDRFQHYFSDPEDESSISNNYISALMTDRQGRLWVGTKHGLNYFDREKEAFTTFARNGDEDPTLPRHEVHTIYQTQNGEIWVGFEEGICLVSITNGHLIPYHELYQNNKPLQPIKVLAITEDSLGCMWLGTDEGLKKWDENKKEFLTIPGTESMHIKTLTQKASNEWWLGTEKGLIIFDLTSSSVQKVKNKAQSFSSLSNDVIHSLLLEKSGTLWVGTGSGLNMYSRFLSQFNTTRLNEINLSDNVSNKVWAIEEDPQGQLWLGTEGGLYALGKDRKMMNHYKADPAGLSNEKISSLYASPEGKLWIGTYGGGLIEHDKQSGSFRSFTHSREDSSSISSDVVRSIESSSDHKTLWVGTTSGLNQFDLKSGRFTSHRFHSQDGRNVKANSVIDLLLDQYKMLWVGTEGGLICYEYDKNISRFFQHNPLDSSSLSHDFVRCIREISDGSLWIGTSGGLNRYDYSTKTFQVFRVEDGLPNDVVYAIEEGINGTLWLSTNKGLSKFDPITKSFENYEVHDGLQGNEFNTHSSLRARDGTIYFGGTRGFNAFQAAQILNNELHADLVITHLEVGNREQNRLIRRCILPNDKLELSYKDYLLNFEFALLNYSNPYRTRYEYMLEGFDKNWNQAEERRLATFTNVPGGNYTLKVRAFTGSNLLSSTELKIYIKPPFWERPLFWGFIALVTLLGIRLWVRNRTRLILKRNAELEAQVLQRTRSLREQKVAIEQSEALFRSFYEDSPIGIAYLEATDCTVVKCNQQFEQILGLDHTRMIGRSFRSFYHPDNAEQDKLALAEAIADSEQSTFQAERRLLHSSGEIIHAYLSISFQRNSESRVDKLIVMLNDITEEKIALEKLQQTQAQLLSADKMASLGQLTAGVAHEINNPVNFIYTGISSLKRNLQALLKAFHLYEGIDQASFSREKQRIETYKTQVDMPEVLEDINGLMLAIEDGAERTAEIVNSLRTFTRSDKSEMQMANIHEGLESTLRIFQQQAGDTIELVKDFDPNLPEILCHPGQLNQVFLNILINALQAIGPGTAGKISISTLNKHQEIEVIIHNTGPAIPEKLQSRIFEPFFTTKEVGQGTGLGLSISYAIIDYHHGSIQVRSGETCGAEFLITLPKYQFL